MDELKLKDFLRGVAEGNENALEVSREILDGGKREKVTLALQRRQLQPEPPEAPGRAESPRREHVFHDVEGFADYLRKYGSEDVVILADSASQVVSAVLDEQAGTGFEVISLQPAVHPLFAPWSGAFGRAMPLAEFLLLLMTHRRAIAEPDGRELALTLSQVKASKQVTLNRGVGARSLNGVMVETVIQGDRKNELVELPETIRLHVPIYVRTDPVEIEADILFNAPGDEIVVLMTSSQAVEAKVNAFEEMLSLLDTDSITVAMGRPGYAPWAYVGRDDDC